MIKLRTEVQKDNLFIESLYRSTREAELKLSNWPEEQKAAFIMMQSMAQQAAYRSKFAGAVFQVIVYKKTDAGRFYIWEGEDEIRLIDITLLPAFRGKGIGTFVLNGLNKMADKAGKKISLHVEPANPALHLYRRLGFVYLRDNGRLYYMERNAGDQVVTSERP
jgi:ribosomal protein S18 acetylase RimI-like enzyme